MKKSISITPILHSRKDKNGLYPVKIRITENRKSKFENLNFSIPKSNWLKTTKRISSSNPNHLEYNHIIEKKITELDSVKKKFGKIQLGRINLFNDLNQKINAFSPKQYYTKKRYRTLYYHLNEFKGSLELYYYEIDKAFFNNFKNYLVEKINPRNKLSNSPSNNTIANYLNTLKTFLIEKQTEGAYFYDLSITKGIIPTKKTTPKKTLTEEEIWKLDNILPNHPDFRKLLWNSLNTFMFNFWSQGLRIGDCLRLKWGNIENGLITLKMEKTDRELIIPLNNSNIQRLRWCISDKELFPIWNWERKEWNNYYPITGEEKNDIEKITEAFPLDILSDAEYKYYEWLNEIDKEKDKLFDEYNLDFSKSYRDKDRYGIEFHNHYKEKNPTLLNFANEYLDAYNKELLFTINQYSKKEEYKNQFIFPFLRGYENERDLNKLSNKVSSSISLINKSLKQISSILLIEKRISTHWARHSITSISKSLGVDVYDLKGWLGHTSVKTTEKYINTINDEAFSKIVDKIKKNLDDKKT